MAFNPDAYLAEGSSGGFDPDAYLGIKKKDPSFLDQIPGILKQAGQAALDSSPAKLTQKFMQTDPATMQRVGGGALPIVGGLAGAPFGLAIPGAAAGELARQATGTAFAPDTVPETGLGRAASVASAGILQEPKILNAVPGVSRISQMASNLASKTGANAAKFMEATTGAKAKDLEQGARQGLSTYKAPSMDEAQQIFGKGLAKEGVSAKPPLENIIDPQLSTARSVAIHVGKLLEAGVELKPQEALLGRQAIDRLYSATPIMDRTTRGHLSDLRTAMNDALSNSSGGIKEASETYRQALVKSNLLNPFRITKQGQMSAVAPMIATLAASAGLASGNKKESGLGALAYLAASSPLVAGLAATTGGSALRGLNAIAQNPATRQALLQVLQRITQNKQPPQEQQ